jgi:hypothetical protein
MELELVTFPNHLSSSPVHVAQFVFFLVSFCPFSFSPSIYGIWLPLGIIFSFFFLQQVTNKFYYVKLYRVYLAMG